jgi:hypothetical protein
MPKLKRLSTHHWLTIPIGGLPDLGAIEIRE